MSFNKIVVVGNLGKDPELRYTPQGIAVCSFSMATNKKRKDKAGDLQDVTTWFKITLWRERAETAAKYLTKGSSVYIEGTLEIEEWTDRDNNNRYTLDVQATDMQFIGTKGSNSNDEYDQSWPAQKENEFSGKQEEPISKAPVTQPAAADDDAPF